MPDDTTAGKNNVLLPLLLLLGAGGLLGLSTNLAKLAGEAGVPSLAFLLWSVGGAAIILLVVGWLRGTLPAVNKKTLAYFMIAGLVTIALSNLILFAAVPRVGASFVALAIAFPPLTTYLGALLLGMERLEARRASGVALALGGAIVLAAYKLSEPDASALWIIATLAAPVLLAVGNIYRTARWPGGETAASLAPGMLVASAVLLLVGAGAAYLFGGRPDIFSPLVPLEGWRPPSIVAAQTATFTVQFLLFFQLQERGGPVYLSLLGSVGAVVGVPIAVLLLGESWPQGIVVGGLLILAGVGLLTYGGAKAAQSENE